MKLCSFAVRVVFMLLLLMQVADAAVLGKLGKSETAKDVFSVNCPAGTVYVKAKINDKSPVAPPLLEVFVTPNSLSCGGAYPCDAFDYTDGDDTAFSSPVWGLGSQSRQYTVMVLKNGSNRVGEELYELRVSCLNKDRVVLSGGTVVYVQNQ